MIYDYPSPDLPLRQGDIFINIPRVDVSLNRMFEFTEGELVVERAWEDIAKQAFIVTPVIPVIGIVASQDRDLVRAKDVTFCEIRPFREVERKSKDAKEPKSWQSIITQQARLNLKWFYLPADKTLGFGDKMGADFQSVFRVQRHELEARRDRMRRGRLNDLACAHFRERISDFFRRYPYDEWYPLDRAEMDSYAKSYPDAKRFPWQESGE